MAAVAAVDAVGLDDRSTLKAALVATLARDERAARAVGRRFDRFFPTNLHRRRKDGAGPGRRPPTDAPPRQARPEERPPPPTAKPSDLPTPGKLGRDLSPEEERRILDEVPELFDRFEAAKGLRPKADRRGAIWPQKAARKALATDGVPFTLPRRSRRPRRPRLLVLCDVSWSVRTASRLFVRLSQALADRFRDTQLFAFVDRPVPLRPDLAGVNLTAPSDYGGTFHALARLGAAGRIDRSTTLVVLGDGRTNGLDPLDWAFEELAGRAGRTVWLVPEPRRRWGTGDSELPAYLAHADVAVEMTDIEGLARGLSACLSP